ncbi:N-acetylglutamate synthase-like GNAT family acetyltransferase [Bacillus mesophilus]|uniref:GNAT family N-acetyltransferase n=1 Tax=Bacillus mesophilus TaxID=1808955 RepID=A0A6M0QBB0_9BACI|nr:GNAT family N-acetyltransferase [Bacillus mesophilus]MBM7662995.1 N-acetylglutamate synthase-like GNAT family acetyltransferase [Bacillus mesophilus]NEY73681.1 GNAT family N-acetyltransferase [Bacillus mesophilus]
MCSHQIKFSNQLIKPEELADLFKMSEIRRPYEDLNRLNKMIHEADILITAWDQEKLVGVARAITDFSYCCYLSDLAVHKDYQKQGIGRRLIELTQKEIGEEVTLLLLASPIAMDYYPHIGFTKVENGYLIPRTR